ncbi:hypothetical protein GCM10011409_25440 [Lentibacillus populi]|uniref:Uncharacterized protein n=1 Tax=Lentibacillus populi TaxID=1827502 RepID=A0A9W5TZD5_9BACI|nr:hypothetical protein GCM10011409_25440 [Lentibacillus populi]
MFHSFNFPPLKYVFKMKIKRTEKKFGVSFLPVLLNIHLKLVIFTIFRAIKMGTIKNDFGQMSGLNTYS